MAVCVCGANITWGQTSDGRRVPLEAFSSYTGDDRYRVRDYNVVPWLVALVDRRDPVAAYPDHSTGCPRRA